MSGPLTFFHFWRKNRIIAYILYSFIFGERIGLLHTYFILSEKWQKLLQKWFDHAAVKIYY
jgi:hypothetical protein